MLVSYRLTLAIVACLLVAIIGPVQWSASDLSTESSEVALGAACELDLPAPPAYSSWAERLLAGLPSAPSSTVFPTATPRKVLYQAQPRCLNRLVPQIERRYPLDLGQQWRMSSDFSPGFLPELYPGRNWDELCRGDYMTSPWLEQRGWANPYRIAADEVEQLNEDDDLALRRAALAAAYWWTHREYEDAELATLQAALGRPQYLSRELLVELLVPKLVELLPASLTEVYSGEGRVPVDLRIETNTSFDSTTCTEQMLLRADQRGLKAVVIADRNRIDGAQHAQRVAQRLRSQGRLPDDFRVIVGEYIETTSGGIVALFLRTWVPAGMTMKKTLEMIHRQDGVALLAHPGVGGGPRMLRQMPFDGYLLQPGLFEMFRTLQILYDPALTNKSSLYGSNSPYGVAVGLPYTIIESTDTSDQGLRRAMVEGRAYAAGGTYLPWMIATTVKPIGQIETILNHYFIWHDEAERQFIELVGADNVIIRTSWDREMQGWMGLDRLAEGISRIGNRTSPLLELPQLQELAVEYSYFQLKYSCSGPRYSLSGRYIW